MYSGLYLELISRHSSALHTDLTRDPLQMDADTENPCGQGLQLWLAETMSFVLGRLSHFSHRNHCRDVCTHHNTGLSIG